MIFLNRLLIICALMLASCASVKQSLIKKNDLLTVPNPDTYSVVGAIRISKLYFDPLSAKKLFEKEAEKTLHHLVPDALYDIDGDTCWITDFDFTTHSLKCLGLCSELSFDILVLKQK